MTTDDYAFDEDEYDADGSRFDYSPPFSRRRNSLKMWTIAASIFALLASGTAVAASITMACPTGCRSISPLSGSARLI